MPELYYSKKFYKSYKKLIRSGSFDDTKLEKILESLENNIKLDAKYKDHKLTGNMDNYRECHIENDLLLVYEVAESGKYIEIVDIGTHSELFG